MLTYHLSVNSKICWKMLDKSGPFMHWKMFYLEGMRCLSRTSRMSWQMSLSSFSTWMETHCQKYPPTQMLLILIFVYNRLTQIVQGGSKLSDCISRFYRREANSLPTTKLWRSTPDKLELPREGDTWGIYLHFTFDAEQCHSLSFVISSLV